jgi:hypothetical protein
VAIVAPAALAALGQMWTPNELHGTAGVLAVVEQPIEGKLDV